jgi:hypothetical protein
MPARKLTIAFLTVVCLVLFAPGGNAQPNTATASACRQVKASGLPGWFVQGAWRNSKTMIVHDVSGRMPVEVSNSGAAVRRPGALAQHIHDLGSVGIRKGTLSPGALPQILIELVGGIVPLNRDFAPQPPIAFAASQQIGGNSGKGAIRQLHDWILVEGDVFGYADIEGEDPNPKSVHRWRNGFVRFQLGTPIGYDVFHERINPDPLRPYFRLSYPFLSSLRDTAYVILMDGGMGLWKLGRRERDLVKMQAFPAHLRGKNAPQFWDWASVEEFPRLMQEVERATMPTGLYAWGDALFVVSRASEKGRQVWYLSKIDPDRDKLLWTVPIVSDANHLTVVPGPKEWAIFEKGPVTRPGPATRLFNQRTDQVLFVDSTRLEARKLHSLCN